jgi:hypothetical protein
MADMALETKKVLVGNSWSEPHQLLPDSSVFHVCPAQLHVDSALLVVVQWHSSRGVESCSECMLAELGQELVLLVGMSELGYSLELLLLVSKRYKIEILRNTNF